MSIPCIVGEKIAKYEDGVALGKNDRYGGCVIKTDPQAVGLYPDKYGPELPPGEVPIEANIFANPYIMMSGQYSRDFWAEGWI